MTTHELFALYRENGLLCPEKLSALGDRLTEVESTWSSLLAAGPAVLRAVLHRAADGTPLAAGSAFAYAPGTWQLQHLVSAARHQPAGALAVIPELLERLEHDGCRHLRFTFCPDSPGVAPMFLPAARRLQHDSSAVSFVDYGIVHSRALQLPSPTVPVRQLAADEWRLADTFLEQCLHPVERASLTLEDLDTKGLDRRYRARRLTRRRTVLAAFDHDRVIGLCIVNRGPFGMNLSLLEQAIEYLRIGRDTVGETRREVWSALLHAAADAAERSAWLVTLTDPEDRSLARDAGLIGSQPRRLAIVTIKQQAHVVRQAIEASPARTRRHGCGTDGVPHVPLKRARAINDEGLASAGAPRPAAVM